MGKLATSKGKLAADLCRMVGLDPDKTISFNISVENDNFIVVKAEFYPTEREVMDVKDMLRTSVLMKT